MPLDEGVIQHRFTNHPPTTPDVGALMDEVTAKFIEVGEWLDARVPDGREHSVMLTNLEQASMWAKAGIARNQEG